MNKNEDGTGESFEILGETKAIFLAEPYFALLHIYMEDPNHSYLSASIDLCKQEVTELRDYLNRYLETTSGVSSNKQNDPSKTKQQTKNTIEEETVEEMKKKTYLKEVMRSWLYGVR